MDTDLKDLLFINEKDNYHPELLDFLKPVGKVLTPYGFNPETKEVNFSIRLIEQVNPKIIIPYIQEIFKFKKPIKIFEKSKEFCIFSILDYETGFDGRYSLLIDENNNYLIFREHFEGNEVVKKFNDLELALKFISKNIYYYENRF